MTHEVTFEHRPAKALGATSPMPPQTVHVAGTFNGWSTTATPMTRGADGVWRATLRLSEGVHHYKFVLDGGKAWLNDPASDVALEEPDGRGGMNSAVLVGPDARKLPPPAATRFNLDGLGHDPDEPRDRNVVAADRLRLSMRAQAGDVESAVAHVRDEGGDGPWRATALHRSAGPAGFERFEGMLTTGGGAARYVFELRKASGAGAVGAGSGARGDAEAVHRHPERSEGAAPPSHPERSEGAAPPSHPERSEGSLGVRGETLRFAQDDRERAQDDRERAQDDGERAPLRAFFASGRLFGSLDEAAGSAFRSDGRVTLDVPEWARHAVWYQVFPERFRNGEAANDPPGTQRWQSRWFATLPGETGRLERDVWKRRYGGDLQGLCQKLPYLRELGVTAIYLNPIFAAGEAHKYDTHDLRHVDAHLSLPPEPGELEGETDDPATWRWSAGDRLFLDVLAEAHRQGFRVILDGVFNHVGRGHPAFQDVLARGRASRYADWFDVTDWGPPLRYRAWDGPDGLLPAFRKDPRTGLADGPRRHVLAVVRRWLAPDGDPSRGVDGFRLDAAPDVPHAFWVELRKVVKATKPDALLVGEVWSSAEPWLRGDQFDAAMNYPFAFAARSFLADQRRAMTPTAFARRLEELAGQYPFQAVLAAQNLLDSHDTARLASAFVNPDLPCDATGAAHLREPPAGGGVGGHACSREKPDAVQRQRLRQAVVLQMTFAGAPMVYYGTEAGMWGPEDPSNRQPMLWADLEPYDDALVRFDEDLFRFYQRAIAARRALPALREGTFRVLLADDRAGTIAFARETGGRRACVVLNRSPAERTVTIDVAEEDGEAALIDYLNPAHAELIPPDPARPDARPTLRPRPGAGQAVRQGKVEVRLQPWGYALLARA